MAIIRTDTPTSRRIVQAFIDFLNSVEPAPGVDLEALEVAKDCLTEVFRPNQLPESERPEPNLLLNIFKSHEQTLENGSTTTHNEEAQTGPSAQNYPTANFPETSQGGVRVKENDNIEVSNDELFGHFFGALEKIRYFSATSNGDDDHVLLDRATRMFHDAVKEMETSGTQIHDSKSLADALKVLGNKAMQSSYSDAIELYTCAIALCENAVYYCNRAAAYTQARKYDEAIRDCLKAIEIDPNYSKAYSRLGLAYYAQGKYSDAINKGFRKALELDPNNEAVKENIRVAEQKLNEEQRRQHGDFRNHFSGASGNQGGSAPFASVSFDSSTFPANFASMFNNMAGNASHNLNGQARSTGDVHETHLPFGASFDGSSIPSNIANMFMNMTGNGAAFQGGQGSASQSRSSEQTPESEATNPMSNFASMFMNMAGNGSQGQNSQGQPQGGNNVGEDPGIRVGGGGAGFSFSFNDQMPAEEVNRTLRSMMGMFSGQPQENSQNNDDGRSASR